MRLWQRNASHGAALIIFGGIIPALGPGSRSQRNREGFWESQLPEFLHRTLVDISKNCLDIAEIRRKIVWFVRNHIVPLRLELLA